MPEVSQVRFTAAGPEAAVTGLLGYVSCTLNDTLHLDGLALRRTRSGHLTLSFPARRDAAGRRHCLIRPLTDEMRKEIERQVFQALGLDREVAR